MSTIIINITNRKTKYFFILIYIKSDAFAFGWDIRDA